MGSTKIELVKDLNDYIKLGYPMSVLLADMAKLAERGYFHDFESPLATTKVDLVFQLRSLGLEDLAKKVINGEYDE